MYRIASHYLVSLYFHFTGGFTNPLGPPKMMMLIKIIRQYNVTI